MLTSSNDSLQLGSQKMFDTLPLYTSGVHPHSFCTSMRCLRMGSTFYRAAQQTALRNSQSRKQRLYPNQLLAHTAAIATKVNRSVRLFLEYHREKLDQIYRMSNDERSPNSPKRSLSVHYESSSSELRQADGPIKRQQRNIPKSRVSVYIGANAQVRSVSKSWCGFDAPGKWLTVCFLTGNCHRPIKANITIRWIQNRAIKDTANGAIAPALSATSLLSVNELWPLKWLCAASRPRKRMRLEI